MYIQYLLLFSFIKLILFCKQTNYLVTKFSSFIFQTLLQKSNNVVLVG